MEIENETPARKGRGKGKAGRHRFIIDEVLAKKFEMLCSIGCYITEIAAVMSIDDNTLKRAISEYYKVDFSVVYAQKRETQKALLRQARWKKVQQGDTTMIIYLSKIILSESETQTVNNTFEVNYANSSAPDFTNS